jgi:hypothetical protein
MTILHQCTCKHSYQDSIYGPGIRVFNKMFAKTKFTNKARCTVCSKIIEVKESKLEEEDKKVK